MNTHMSWKKNILGQLFDGKLRSPHHISHHQRKENTSGKNYILPVINSLKILFLITFQSQKGIGKGLTAFNGEITQFFYCPSY